MATKAQVRFEQEQTVRRLLDEDGIRFAGVYGSPYPASKSITRYHVVLAIETYPTYEYVEFVIGPEYAGHPTYGAHVGQRASRAVPSTTSRATFACGVDSMLVSGDRPDVRELVEVDGERATDAPICKQCARIAGIEI